MRKGRCPKCGSADVFARRNGIGQDGGSVFLYGLSLVTLPTTIESYVCTGCGYFENYVADGGKLSKVTRRWDKVR